MLTVPAPAHAARPRAWLVDGHTTALLALLIAHFLIRAAFAASFFLMGDDAIHHDRLATNLLAGHGFSLSEAAPYVPSLNRDPFYPAFLAGIYGILGQAMRAVFWLQAVLSTATAYVAYLIALRLFSRRTALLTVLLLALHLPMASLVPHLMTETLYTFLLVCAHYAALRAFDGGYKAMAASGLLFGIATLTRNEAMLFPPVILATLAWRGDWWKVLRGGSILLAMFGALLAPWVARNWRVAGIPLLRDPAVVVANLRRGAGYAFTEPLAAICVRHFPHWVPPEKLKEYRRQILAEYVRDLRERPLALLKFRVVNVLGSWLFTFGYLPGMDVLAPYDLKQEVLWLAGRAPPLPPGRTRPPYPIRLTLIAIFGILPTALGTLGAVQALSAHRLSPVLLAYPAYILLLHIPLFTVGRYLMPAQTVAAPLAALGLARLTARLLPERTEGDVRA